MKRLYHWGAARLGHFSPREQKSYIIRKPDKRHHVDSVSSLLIFSPMIIKKEGFRCQLVDILRLWNNHSLSFIGKANEEMYAYLHNKHSVSIWFRTQLV